MTLTQSQHGSPLDLAAMDWNIGFICGLFRNYQLVKLRVILK